MRFRIAALCLAMATVPAWAGLGLTQVNKAPSVTVLVDQQRYQVSTAASTVGDLLQDLGITLSKLDRTDPSPKTALTEGAVIRVTRISRRQVVEDAPVKAKTILLAVTGRPTGFTKTLHEGQDGLVRRTVEIWEKDGQLAKREVVAEKVLKPTVDHLVLRSTPNLTNRGGTAGNFRRPRRMEATAYDPGPRSCGPNATGRTASGRRACKGVVAVDTRVIPFGTRLYIPGYGFAIAADRGGAIKGNRIDLCFDTYREAVQFGRQWVDVYLLPASATVPD